MRLSSAIEIADAPKADRQTSAGETEEPTKTTHTQKREDKTLKKKHGQSLQQSMVAKASASGDVERKINSEKTWLPKWLRVILIVVVAIPLLVMAMALIFGSLLAGLEGWVWSTGFYYVVSNLVGLGNPLTNVSPDTTVGKLVDIVIAVWSLSLAGAVIGIIASFSIFDDMANTLEGSRDEKQSQETKQVEAMDIILKSFHHEEGLIMTRLADILQHVASNGSNDVASLKADELNGDKRALLVNLAQSYGLTTAQAVAFHHELQTLLV